MLLKRLIVFIINISIQNYFTIIPEPFPNTVIMMYLKYKMIVKLDVILATVSAKSCGVDISILMICDKPVMPGTT